MEDVCIIDLIEKEKVVGLYVVIDGEFWWSWWYLDFLWGLIGVGYYNYY